VVGVLGVFGGAGDVDAGDVVGAVGEPGGGEGDGLAGVFAAQEDALLGGEEGAGGGQRLEEVLGADEGVADGEARDLALDEGAVGGIDGGAVAPVELEVALDAVGGLELEVELLLLLEEGVLGPGGAVEDGGGVGGRGHGPEVAGELVGVDVLGFVDLEQEGGGGADDGGGGIGGEEGDAGVAEDELVAVLLLGLEDDLVAVGVAAGERGELPGGPEQRLEALHGRSDLGAEGGGGLDEGVAGGGVAGEETGLEVGGELVLAELAGHHDGEGGAEAVEDRREDGGGDLFLVGAQGAAEDVEGEAGGHAGVVDGAGRTARAGGDRRRARIGHGRVARGRRELGAAAI
jgi:hypothetical protein